MHQRCTTSTATCSRRDNDNNQYSSRSQWSSNHNSYHMNSNHKSNSQRRMMIRLLRWNSCCFILILTIYSIWMIYYRMNSNNYSYVRNNYNTNDATMNATTSNVRRSRQNNSFCYWMMDTIIKELTRITRTTTIKSDEVIHQQRRFPRLIGYVPIFLFDSNNIGSKLENVNNNNDVNNNHSIAKIDSNQQKRSTISSPLYPLSYIYQVITIDPNNTTQFYSYFGNDEYSQQRQKLSSNRTKKNNTVDDTMMMGNRTYQKAIEYDNEYYDMYYINPDLNDTCQLKYAWQTNHNISNCNTIHEYDISSNPYFLDDDYDTSYYNENDFDTSTNDNDTMRRRKPRKRYKMIGTGYWRNVFIVDQDIATAATTTNNSTKNLKMNKQKLLRVSFNRNNNLFVFKSIRYMHEFTIRNYDRMKRDALIMEQLTSSNFIIDIYAYCGTSSFSEYGSGNDISYAIWPPPAAKQPEHSKKLQQQESSSSGNNNDNSNDNNIKRLTQLEKLHVATQAAIGLAVLHNFDSEGQASVAHTDISPNQYIKVNNIYKLNDFNRARFIPYTTAVSTNSSSNTSTACSYHIGNNPGKNRAPEEYKLEPQSEKVDIYSLGNIFYMLLQGEYPFEDTDAETAQKLVADGHRPSIYVDVWNSTDPIDQALKEIMIRCHEQDPIDRPSAREVETYLTGMVRKLDPGRLEEWGIP